MSDMEELWNLHKRKVKPRVQRQRRKRMEKFLATEETQLAELFDGNDSVFLFSGICSFFLTLPFPGNYFKKRNYMYPHRPGRRNGYFRL